MFTILAMGYRYHAILERQHSTNDINVAEKVD